MFSLWYDNIYRVEEENMRKQLVISVEVKGHVFFFENRIEALDFVDNLGVLGEYETKMKAHHVWSQHQNALEYFDILETEEKEQIDG